MSPLLQPGDAPGGQAGSLGKSLFFIMAASSLSRREALKINVEAAELAPSAERKSKA